MNICIITPQYPPISGGIGSTVYRVARNLTEADYNVHVIAPGSNSIENIITPSWEHGITVHRAYSALGEHLAEYMENFNFSFVLHADQKGHLYIDQLDAYPEVIKFVFNNFAE